MASAALLSNHKLISSHSLEKADPLVNFGFSNLPSEMSSPKSSISKANTSDHTPSTEASTPPLPLFSESPEWTKMDGFESFATQEESLAWSGTTPAHRFLRPPPTEIPYREEGDTIQLSKQAWVALQTQLWDAQRLASVVLSNGEDASNRTTKSGWTPRLLKNKDFLQAIRTVTQLQQTQQQPKTKNRSQGPSTGRVSPSESETVSSSELSKNVQTKVSQWQAQFERLSLAHEAQMQKCQDDLLGLYQHLEAYDDSSSNSSGNSSYNSGKKTSALTPEEAQRLQGELERMVAAASAFPSPARMEALESELESVHRAHQKTEYELMQAQLELKILHQEQTDFLPKLVEGDDDDQIALLNHDERGDRDTDSSESDKQSPGNKRRISAPPVLKHDTQYSPSGGSATVRKSRRARLRWFFSGSSSVASNGSGSSTSSRQGHYRKKTTHGGFPSLKECTDVQQEQLQSRMSPSGRRTPRKVRFSIGAPPFSEGGAKTKSYQKLMDDEDNGLEIPDLNCDTRLMLLESMADGATTVSSDEDEYPMLFHDDEDAGAFPSTNDASESTYPIFEPSWPTAMDTSSL